MTSHEQLINDFYTAFADGDYNGMADCYHNDIEFSDPAFGTLKGDRAKQMWQMLLSNKTAAPQVKFSDISINDNTGTAHWVAEYFYGPNKRKVINRVAAQMTFLDGKILKHQDDFDIWKWSRQALGPAGYLLGWSPFMKAKIQKLANKKLDQFVNSQ